MIWKTLLETLRLVHGLQVLVYGRLLRVQARAAEELLEVVVGLQCGGGGLLWLWLIQSGGARHVALLLNRRGNLVL